MAPTSEGHDPDGAAFVDAAAPAAPGAKAPVKFKRNLTGVGRGGPLRNRGWNIGIGRLDDGGAR